MILGLAILVTIAISAAAGVLIYTWPEKKIPFPDEQKEEQ